MARIFIVIKGWFREKKLSMAANWLGEMVVRMRNVLATPSCCETGLALACVTLFFC